MGKVLSIGKKYLPYKYEIRWVNDYLDGTSKAGLWTRSGNHPANKWSRLPIRGLLRGRIESKCRITNEIKTRVEVPADKLIAFQDIGITALPMNPARLQKHFGDFRFAPSIHGVTAVTPDKKIHVFIDGTIDVKPNNDPINFRIWS